MNYNLKCGCDIEKKGNAKCRNPQIDILRGIGILAIVIGHASWQLDFEIGSIDLGQFLYLFHVPLFFFIGGTVINLNHIEDIWFFFGKRFKSLYCPFIGFNLFLVLIRPIFCFIGVYDQKYSLMDNIILICNILLFQPEGEFASALWFVPVYFISLFIAILILKKTSQFVYGNIIMFIIAFAIGLLGAYLILRSCQFNYRLEIAFLMCPIICLGYFLYNYTSLFRIDSNIVIIVAVILLLSLYFFMQIFDIQFDVALNMIMNPYIFYPIAIWGIIMCICWALAASRWRSLGGVLSYIGKHSFEIMSLHLLAFKIVDVIYVTITNDNYDVLKAFPRGPQNLTLFYWVCGIFMPIFLSNILHRFYLKIIRVLGVFIPNNRRNLL